MTDIVRHAGAPSGDRYINPAVTTTGGTEAQPEAEQHGVCEADDEGGAMSGGKGGGGRGV